MSMCYDLTRILLTREICYKCSIRLEELYSKEVHHSSLGLLRADTVGARSMVEDLSMPHDPSFSWLPIVHKLQIRHLP